MRWQVARSTRRSPRLANQSAPRRSSRVGTETPAWLKAINTGTAAAANYYASLAEIEESEIIGISMVTNEYIEYANVGAGVGGGFDNTAELKPMKYEKAIQGPDGEAWKKEIENEHNRMVAHGVFEPVHKDDLPNGVVPIDSTWACKKKSNGKLRGRLNARGFRQIADVHYDQSSIHAPVTNGISIRVLLTLMIMAGWVANVVDVKGAFLHGEFTDGEVIYMKVPKGFERYYGSNVVLRLLKTIYGLKQAAMAFWKMLLKCMKDMGMLRSTADPCIYFDWSQRGLVVIASWIDDNLIVGSKEAVSHTKEALMSRFECEDCGELDEYVGCRLTRTDGAVKFTQEVLIQSFVDEFEIPSKKYATPAKPGNILTKGDPELAVEPSKQTYYRSGVGKMIHMMQWSRPDICSAVRDLTRHMQMAIPVHIEAMHHVMAYCVRTKERGMTLRPNCKWDGNKEFLFTVGGRSDSDYATNPETRKSVSGCRVSLNGAVVAWRSSTQKHVTLSVTEAEMAAGVTCVQDMMYVRNLLMSLGLQVQVPMVLEMDNKGAVDLANSWSVGGRTRHVDVRIHYVRELKEAGILLIKWVPGPENDADMHTKNVSRELFEKFGKVYFGKDRYYAADDEDTPVREGARGESE